MSAELAEIVTFLDQELRTGAISDYPGAVNGLQLANSGAITRIVAAVDASLAVIEEAARGGSGLLVVHHGLFWQGAQPLRGPVYRKFKTAMDADLAIYSSHLPLDVHPVWGNNAQLAKAVGCINPQPFLERNGLHVGLRSEWTASRGELASRLEAAVGGPVHLCPGGPDRPESVAIITGGAGSEVSAVAATGIDTFITGEGPHWSYPLAEELGVNLFYAGHYATETFGVRALAAELACRFRMRWRFVDRPTGL
jgi:dinuclear metal center YbgI/SA1388 family protein